jgi:hypothetical protein
VHDAEEAQQECQPIYTMDEVIAETLQNLDALQSEIAFVKRRLMEHLELAQGAKL